MSTTRNPKSTKPKAKASTKSSATKRKREKPTVEAEQASASRPIAASDSTAKPASGLDAAALILRDAGEPLDTKTVVARMLERGLWSTSGKTPAATIYSAMIREINGKGSTSRFRKVGAGRFTAT